MDLINNWLTGMGNIMVYIPTKRKHQFFGNEVVRQQKNEDFLMATTSYSVNLSIQKVSYVFWVILTIITNASP